jgi:hypothetical protein
MKKLFFIPALFLLLLALSTSTAFFKTQIVLAVGQPCCSNPFDGRSGWYFDQSGNQCVAQVGLGYETRSIECGVGEYCDANTETCLAEGTTTSITPSTDSCGQIGQACCENPSRAPRFYCKNGQPQMETGRSQTCVCIAASKPKVSAPSTPSTSSTTPNSSDPTCDIKGKKGIETAIGCIPIEDTNSLLGFILKWAIGIGGGIAFLLILVAGFQIMTSTGDPKRLQAGKELLTSAIAGLILLIFSVFILRIIGVDILGIFPARP